MMSSSVRVVHDGGGSSMFVAATEVNAGPKLLLFKLGDEGMKEVIDVGVGFEVATPFFFRVGPGVGDVDKEMGWQHGERKAQIPKMGDVLNFILAVTDEPFVISWRLHVVDDDVGFIP